MDVEFTERRLILRRTAEEKEPLLQRLNRIEGQVRGMRQMVEADRHCLDVVQQANAVTAAVREVALLVIQDHLAASVKFSVETHDGAAALEEMVTVLRAALRR